MATFVEVVLSWLPTYCANGRQAAILLKNVTPLRYAQSGFPVDHHFSTAAVNLLQGDRENKDCWMALSYAPTAACVGMAALLGIRRIVWRDENSIVHSITLNATGVAEVTGAQAIVFQADRSTYNQPYPPPYPGEPNRQIPRVLGNFVQAGHNLPAAGTADLIQRLVGADDIVRKNACLLLAFAIASEGHGALHDNPKRSAANLGQNIASILVDSNYQIMRWAINTNVTHPSLHGEINLIRSYQTANPGPLPQGGKLFTTLEPCVMCSGMIVHTAGIANPFEVISGQADSQVHFSALRDQSRTDGYSTSQRSVTSTLSAMPLLLEQPFKLAEDRGEERKEERKGDREEKKEAGKVRAMRSFGAHLQGEQVRMSPASSKLMPTTKFLEQHGAPVMSDAAKIFDKLAALWVPAAQRAAWRASRDEFLASVRARIRG